VLHFREGLGLTAADLSPEEVVLALVKSRNFAQLEAAVLAGPARARDLEGQPAADQTAGEHTQDEFRFARRRPVVNALAHGCIVVRFGEYVKAIPAH
jgi:hypothetical protein